MRQNYFTLSCTCITVKFINSDSVTKINFTIEYHNKLIIVKYEMCYIKVHKVQKERLIYCTEILHILYNQQYIILNHLTLHYVKKY